MGSESVSSLTGESKRPALHSISLTVTLLWPGPGSISTGCVVPMKSTSQIYTHRFPHQRARVIYMYCRDLRANTKLKKQRRAKPYLNTRSLEIHKHTLPIYIHTLTTQKACYFKLLYPQAHFLTNIHKHSLPHSSTHIFTESPGLIIHAHTHTHTHTLQLTGQSALVVFGLRSLVSKG